MFKVIDGIKVEYEYINISDKCVVFLHGFGGNLNNFSYFAKVFNNFGYSTLNINLTDFGFKNLPKFFNIYSFADIVYKLIKLLKIKNFNLIGHSFGGRISIILSSMYKCVNKLILVDSAGIKPRFNLKIYFKICKYKFYKKLLNYNVKIQKKLSESGSNDYKSLNDSQRCVFKNIINEDLVYLLKNITVKTLIIFGKKDKDTPIYMAKKLNKKIKNSRLILFSGGHYCYVEEAQKFINLVKNFLEE